ncbi:MAG TPA: YbaL family putative K(+) efflux transporter [Rhodopila sp.]
MPHATALIALIALGLVSAFIGGMLAQKLRLPPLVGYLVAGIALGPFTPGFVGDAELAGQLAEIGVILLMFGVGLHFSIKDLVAVRTIALPGAIVQIVVATAMGAALAVAMGWGWGAGLIFGLSLSVASTVVLLRALEGQGILDTDKGRIAVGWLIVEDLAMVLALVLLPALAPSLNGAGDGGGSGAAGHGAAVGNLWLTLGMTLAKVALFATLMLVAGRRFVPWLLDQAAQTGSRELFTLAVLALALGIAFGSAELFGVSFALGAFFAGMVLAESDLSHQAAANSLPLRDAFAVLFFVSVGMLFDPAILVRQPLAILAVLGVIMLGKSLAAVLIVLAFRHPLGTALTIAASLAQIGEFSFILVSLGMSLDILPAAGRDLILAGALLSITLNPLAFALADKAIRFLATRPGLAAKFERRDSSRTAVATHAEPRSGHAVIVGYGRVGGIIGKALKAWGLPYIVVDENRRRILDLRARGIEAVFGDAAAPGVLHAADIEQARLLVIATPEFQQALRQIEIARAANPAIDIVVRSHSEAERRQLQEHAPGPVLVGEQELAFGMTHYALRSLGVPDAEANAFVSARRTEGLAEHLVPPEADQVTPELRLRREGAAE